MKGKKYISIFIGLLIFVSLASAGLWTHFAQVKPTFNVEQSITIDGRAYNNPIVFEQNVIAGDTVTTEHILIIKCNQSVNITSTITSTNGINVSIKIDGQTTVFPVCLKPGKYPLTITYVFPVNLTPGKYKPIIKFGVE